MKAIELLGRVDETRHLQVEIPETLPPGPVRIIVLIPEEDEAEAAWMQGIAHEWVEELNDSREDIYSLEDGKPVHATKRTKVRRRPQSSSFIVKGSLELRCSPEELEAELKRIRLMWTQSERQSSIELARGLAHQ